MKPEIKAKWVAALRSGEYEQTQGQLREETIGGKTSFCCLGVLCNLHAQSHPKIAATQSLHDTYLGHHADLPLQVVKWAGLHNEGGAEVVINGEKSPLWDHNDNGVSIERLASAIEAQL